MILSDQDIRTIVRQYDIGFFKNAIRISGSGNLSYKIITGSGNYFLRLCGERNRWRSKKNITGELSLLYRLHKKNIPVILDERMKNGDHVLLWAGRNGYLRRFIGGKRINCPTKKQIFSVGSMLGKIHNAVENYKAGGLRNNINFGIDATISYFNTDIKKKVKNNSQDEYRFIEGFEQEMKKIKLPQSFSMGMVHEDLGKRHIFWQEGDISAIIDFDRSYYGYLILDLGQALRSWCFVDNWREWKNTNVIFFLRGYIRERKLNYLEKKYLLAAVKFAILERGLSFFSNWIYFSRKKDKEFAYNCLFQQIKEIEKSPILHDVNKAF